MSQEAERRRRQVVVGLAVTWLGWLGCAQAEELGGDRHVALFENSREILRAERPLRGRDLGAVSSADANGYSALALRKQIDVSPVLDEIFGFFHHHGVPLQEQLDDDGDGPIGVYANFSVGRDMPAVSFHLGDRPMEPLGAFYSSDRGFHCALVWPVKRFTLRLEGGEDSEFGYYGIAGVQWMDSHRPLAIGIGIPMNLRDAQGGVGVVVQLRMNLE